LKRNKIREFKIPISYEVYGEIVVEARTAKEALAYANENIDLIDLPEHVEYVDGSFEINNDLDLVVIMNKKRKEEYRRK
jgi:hypothetical protein